MSAVELQQRMRMLRVVSGVLLLAGCGWGCVFPDRWVHDPPLARNIPRIVRGQTTGTQILEYFGVPDLEAHGPVVTLHDDSVMGKQRQKNMRALERAEMAAERYNTNGGRRGATGTDLLDEMARLWAYSSIDEDHIAYLYLEMDYRGTAWIMPIGWPIVAGGSDHRVLQNKLLVLINRHTGVVDEFGYRQEFNAR